ncbi:sodium channel protein 60E-like [Sycon ciliatum]|uniref:sodium channel protein 60E-like n=1 Tax=Sycon ciliatum TaxID=27933 RepID=UPI0031F61017
MINGIKNADFNPGNPAAAAVRKARDEGAEEPLEALFVVATRLKKKYVYCFDKSPSLGYFHTEHPLRQFAIWLTTNLLFDFVVISVILANCVLLALDDPPVVPEYAFLGVYTVEMLFKILAQGFVRHHFTYLRDGWNRLDAVVIVLGYVALIPTVGNLSGFRALRVLRALRAINALPGLRIMVNSLLSSLQAIVSVFILMFCFIIMVAVLGLQLFSGVLRHKCVRELPMLMNGTDNGTMWNDTALETTMMMLETTTAMASTLTSTSLPFTPSVSGFNFADYAHNASNWQLEMGLPVVCGNASSARLCAPGYVCLPDVGDNPRFGFLNFDNFGWSMLTSFQLVTSDNWEDVYNHILASQGPAISIIFFFFVIFLGFFYVLNLVLAIVTIAYNKEVEKEKSDAKRVNEFGIPRKTALLDLDRTNSEQEGPDVKVKTNRRLDGRELLRQLTLSIGFEVLIGGCIVINTIVLAIEHPFIDEELGFGLCVCNVVFTMVFFVEAMLKIFAHRGLPYFRSKWNVFDFLLVLISLSELIYIGALSGTICGGTRDDSHIATALRTFRLLRVLKLARSWTTMKALLSIISNSLWDVGNLTMIMIIVIYTFALVGTHLFRHYYTPADLNRGGVERWNFSDFVHSCVTIFTILCGEWVLPLYDTMRVSSPFAVLFYILVICVGNFLILNLFVALLLNSFNLENWQASVQKAAKKHQQQHKSVDPDFLRRMNIPWLAKKQHHRPDMHQSLSRSNSFPNISTVPSATTSNCPRTSIDIVREVNDTKEDELATCLGCKSQFSMEQGPAYFGRLRRSQSYGGPFCIPNDEEDDSPAPKVMLRVVPSLPVSKDGSALPLLQQATMIHTINEDEDVEMCSLNRLTLAQSPHTVSSGTNICVPGTVHTTTDFSPTALTLRPGSSSGDIRTPCDSINGAADKPLAFDSLSHEESPGKRFRLVSAQIMRKIEGGVKSSWSFHRPSCSTTTEIDLPGKKTSRALRFVRKARRICHWIVTAAYFEYVVLILVVGSSISLAFEDSTVVSNSSRHRLLNILNIFFAVCFTVEMLMKWFGLGLKEYFKNSWNILDFIIVLISLISLDYTGNGEISVYAGVRVVRTLRCLRPLRAISRWPSMKVVVNALISAIPSIANVLLVCLIFWLIFSIMGVQFFGGRFYSCLVNDTQVNASIVPDRETCVTMYGNSSWKNAAVNYDNVVNAALALFQVATFEGWIEIMAASVDAVGLNRQPIFENNLYAYLFYVVFIIVGAFFTLNLFIGVIIDNFSRIRKDHANDRISGGGGARLLLTNDQQRWMSTMLKLAYAKPRRIAVRPENVFQRYCYHIAKSNRFDLAIIILIMMNLVVLAVQHHNQPEPVTNALYILNIFFTAVYGLEALIKLVGLRTGYFLDNWNNFDFVVLILSIAALVLESFRLTFISIDPTALRVIRVFRVIRLVRLIHHYRGIRKLIITLTYSLPALVNVGGLLMLMIYIYGILGINLFGHVKLTGALSDQVNFKTIGRALLVLFRLSTAAGWNDILNPLVIEPPDCDPEFEGLVNGNCGYPVGAPIYFVTFTVFTFLIILNLYVAIILENYVEVSEDSIFEDDIDAFYYRWAKFDPKASQFIHIEKVVILIRGLKGALKVEDAGSETIAELNLPVYEDHSIHCLDLLKGLVKIRLGMVDENEAMSQVIERIEDRFAERFPRRTARKPIYHTSRVLP